MLKSALIEAIFSATGVDRNVVSKVLTSTKELKHGDLALPCFLLAKELKCPPPECAKTLAEKIELPDGFDRAEAVGPYLNFFYDRSKLSAEVVDKVLSAGDSLGRPEELESERIVIDYSHPNVAKPFHVGHLRTTFIGHSIDRLFRHLGHEVSSVNHLGDWGTQFGFIYAGCQLWGKPDTSTTDSLVELYIRASKLKKDQEEGNVSPEDKEHPDVDQIAKDFFLRLQAGDKEAVEFWQWCLDLSLEYLKEEYARLGLSFDYYTGESFYRDQLEDTKRLIEESGVLEESRGALGVDCGKKLGFARMFTEDGRSLYLTRDVAAAIYREKTFSPHRIVYVVSMAQTLHFQQLKEILKRMKHPVADKIVHVPFGQVPGMSTRRGTAILLGELLNEARQRALEAYRHEVEKRPEEANEEEIAEAVAIGAIFFYFLNHNNIKDFAFDWREALNFQGDSGPYLQYAYARLSSIQNRAAEEGIELGDQTDGSLLCDDAAHELVSLLNRFEEVLVQTADAYEPSILAQYVLQLGRVFSSSYKSLRVVGAPPDEAQARLRLFSAAKLVLEKGLSLLGVPIIAKM